MSTINSNEHSAKRYVRNEPGQPLALESIATSQGRHPTNRATSEKQGRVCERSGMEESEASRSAAETNCLDRSSYQQGTVVICIVSACLSPPTSHASCTFGALAPAPRPAPLVLYSFGEAHAARGEAPLSVRKGRSGWFCQTCVGCYLSLFILCP